MWKCPWGGCKGLCKYGRHGWWWPVGWGKTFFPEFLDPSSSANCSFSSGFEDSASYGNGRFLVKCLPLCAAGKPVISNRLAVVFPSSGLFLSLRPIYEIKIIWIRGSRTEIAVKLRSSRISVFPEKFGLAAFLSAFFCPPTPKKWIDLILSKLETKSVNTHN